jgi:hypothetical protein
MSGGMDWGDFRPRSAVRGLWRALAAALAGALCLAATPAVAAPPVATAKGTARAVIVTPLTLVKSYDMNFGRLLASSTAGTVRIDPVTNGCSTTGGVTEHGSCQYAQFVGMGTKNMKARVSMSGPVQLTGPGAAMTLDTFVIGASSNITFQGNTNSNGNGIGLTNGNGNQRYSIDSSTGIFVLNIGGTLHVNANQAPGIYNATFTVTVQYN